MIKTNNDDANNNHHNHHNNNNEDEEYGRPAKRKYQMPLIKVIL